MRIWVIYYAIALHFVWAGMLVFYPMSAAAPPLQILLELFHWRLLTALSLIVSSIMAIHGTVKMHSRSIASLWLLMPQQAIMILSAVGATLVAMNSADAIRPTELIVTNQASAFLAAVAHSGALLDHYATIFFVKVYYCIWNYLRSLPLLSH